MTGIGFGGVAVIAITWGFWPLFGHHFDGSYHPKAIMEHKL